MIGRIGVCSWSLGEPGAGELVERVREAGVRYVQLGLGPLREDRERCDGVVRALQDAGIEVVSGMIRLREPDGPDGTQGRAGRGGLCCDERWLENERIVQESAELAHRLGIDLVTCHVGPVPEEGGGAARRTFMERLGLAAEVFAQKGVRLGLETGQEGPEALAGALAALDRETLGVNFDPANFIISGTGDPVGALRVLARWVMQVHIKDAAPAREAGGTGREMPAGAGVVDWPALFGVMRGEGVRCDLLIERRWGEHAIEEIGRARRLVEGLLQPTASR